jgi:hypothetical protein
MKIDWSKIVTKEDKEQKAYEQKCEQVRAERDKLIENVRWRIERHNDEVALDIEVTEPIEPILEYIQALRDIPQQEGFPTNIVWPEAPV